MSFNVILSSLLKKTALSRLKVDHPTGISTTTPNYVKPDIGATLGVIAGNGRFPVDFIQSAKKSGYRVAAVCHLNETDQEVAELADIHVWIKVGELGKIIKTFHSAGVTHAVMAGGISRVKAFSDVNLDLKGALLLLKIRSTRDDVIMRAIAAELEKEGILFIPCTIFSSSAIVKQGVIAGRKPTKTELSDIDLGRQAIISLGKYDIGQVVIVKEGVIVAVEAIEGTDATIIRGGELAGPGTVIVKCAKPGQDMRFDVPTIGPKTLESLERAKAGVLALEAGRSIIMDRQDVIERSNQLNISLFGCEPLV